MLSILQRMYDLTPNNPVTIIEPVTAPCTSIDDTVPIGGKYLRHAFIVLQDADITVKNAAGNTIKRGTDYFTISRATDQAYSKQYSTSIYSGLKFKATGTYTVTSFISCGTYPRAGWFNYLFEQLLTLRDVTVAALSTAVSSLRSDLNNMISTVQSTAASLSSLWSEYSNHAADTDIHITSVERAKWNGKSKIHVVADITARNALSGLTAGDCAYVVNDGDGKRAEYMWTGSAYLKISDPDWENLSLVWTNLTGIPANVESVVNAAGVTAAATLGAIAMRGADGKMASVTPVDTDANQTVATIEYVKAKVTAVGGGNVSTSDTISTDGEIVVTDGVTGKLVKKSGTLLGTLLGYFSGGRAKNLASTTITSGDISQIITLGAGTYIIGNLVTGIPLAAYFRATIMCNPTALSGSGSATIVLEQGGTQKRYTCQVSNGVIYYGAGLTATAFSSSTWTLETDGYARSMRSTIVDVGASSFKTVALANIGVKDFNCIATSTDTPYSGFIGTIEVKWIDASTYTLRAVARTTGNFMTHEIFCSAGTWSTAGVGGWVPLTDVSGNAENAVNSSNNAGYIGCGDVLQSGSMTLVTDITANFTGYVRISIWMPAGRNAISIGTLYVEQGIIWDCILPIKQGQTFRVSGDSFSSCNYYIRAKA